MELRWNTLQVKTEEQYSFSTWLAVLKQFKPMGHCDRGCHHVFQLRHIADRDKRFKHLIN